LFSELGLPSTLVSHEVAEMENHQMTKTASRSVLGTMNDFTFLAEAHRSPKTSTGLVELSLRLAQTPCGPLHHNHISPDREIIAYLAGQPLKPATGIRTKPRSSPRYGFWHGTGTLRGRSGCSTWLTSLIVPGTT
jgi:hypothetical protein